MLLAVALVGVRLAGLEVYAVLSGSMEPTYHTGSVVYVKSCDPVELASGDVITFMLDENTIATHRIVEVVPDEADPSVVRFRTQGDANDAPDGSLVHCKNVIGMPVFTIPGLGYLANYIQHPPGTYVAISVCAVLVMLTFLPDLFERESPSRQGEGSRSAKESGSARGNGRGSNSRQVPKGQGRGSTFSLCTERGSQTKVYWQEAKGKR